MTQDMASPTRHSAEVMAAAPRPVRARPSRRDRLTSRALPLALLAVAALAAGLVVGAGHQPSDRRLVQRYLAAWTRGDHAGMYQLLSTASRGRVTSERFVRMHRNAARTATLERVARAGELRDAGDGRFRVSLRLITQRFGELRATTTLPVESDDEGQPGIRWERHLAFPALRPGEKLSRTVEMPPRGTLQARDGRTIAEGEARTGDLGTLAAEIAGQVGPIPPEQAEAYEKQGYPADAVVGLTGLERQFEQRLAGTFGGALRAGERLLASAEPRQGGAVRTSIDPELEAAAVSALAGRFGGVAVMDPRSGEVLALAGIAYSAPQPPGSVFKIVTLAGALEAGVVKPSDEFPVETAATLSGVRLENANGESCGGSLANAFAHSCNSVFAPMGAELGAERLVAVAERFGFNAPSRVPGAAPSSIPPANEIGDDLAVGATAIGQGRVTATPLHFARIASAIAEGGELVRPSFLRGEEGERTRAVSPRVARIVRRYMRRVVKAGTGEAAAIPGIPVAGKTGTAELRDSTPEDGELVLPGEEPAAADDTTDTNAWFVAFAPARKPRVAVAVMLVGAGAGGATAAPAAKVVLEAALRG
jgi:hypothetical protein